MFLDNRYASSKLLSIITYDWNRAVHTFGANIIRFNSEALNTDNKVERLSFIWLDYKQLDMVVGEFKGSIILHTVSTFINLGCQEVHSRNGKNILHVRCPNIIVEY